jgi:hypothetical protein
MHKAEKKVAKETVKKIAVERKVPKLQNLEQAETIERLEAQFEAVMYEKDRAIERSEASIGRVVKFRADNSRGPGGPMGPLCTPLKTPRALSRPSITH